MIPSVVKWAAFALAVPMCFSAGRWLREHPTARLRAWTLLGAMPFIAPGLYTSLTIFRHVPSDIHGIDVGAIDLLALSLLFASRPTSRPVPFRVPLFLYSLVVVLSVTQARWLLPALGYPWELARMYLLLLAIWRGGNEDPRVPAALLRGMTFSLVYVGALSVWQRFGLGLERATATFDHQNILGGMVNLAVMVPIVRILGGRTSLATKLAPVAGMIASILTVSRGALLFLGMGAALVYTASAFRRFTPRKAWIGMFGLALGAVVATVALASIESHRTAEERAGSLDTRWQLEEAASMMLQEHPLGVGPGFFTVELVLGGYGARAGLGWSMRTALVHNIYWAIAAEMGYAGLVTLLILFAAPLLLALRYGLRRGPEPQREILLSLAISLVVLYVHGLYEFVWRLTEVTHLYFMIAGMIALLAQQLRSRRVSGRPAQASNQSSPGMARPTSRTSGAGGSPRHEQ